MTAPPPETQVPLDAVERDLGMPVGIEAHDPDLDPKTIDPCGYDNKGNTMRRSFLGRVIPAASAAVGIAIPSATAALVMLHAMISGSTSQSALPAPSSGASVAAAVTPTPQPAAPAPTRITTQTIAGPVVDDQFGHVQATITVKGSRITSVSITAPEDDPRSAMINQQAVPLLQTETLQAQSANVNLISGATVTSGAYIQSLQGALQTAGL